MGADADAVVAELNAIPGYAEQFEAVFGGPATPDNVVQAIAAFERDAFYCGDTVYDDWRRRRRQRHLGRGHARSGTLHRRRRLRHLSQRRALLTDMKFHNVGIGMDAEDPDLGRARVTEEDVCSTTEDEPCQGAFKTPTLRDHRRRAPRTFTTEAWRPWRKPSG